ncbi:hypothetical protein KY290_007192 [Solanum tuberosum]|uniref:Uncharacterized protein n=1 Tax=Solanum tuberosum TaxID=4113 RepID=A0ABQ7W4U4_SOLTU|nr:hypothetical protein KY290_007192 [Solanum tuberosum]
MGKYDCVYEWDITSYERDMEKQGGRGNDDKNCDVDIRGEMTEVKCAWARVVLGWVISCEVLINDIRAETWLRQVMDALRMDVN